MPVVFIIGRDWGLRANVRAQLRETGIEALGMESPEDAGSALAQGQMPSALVLEATSGIADQESIRELVRRVPTVVVASRTETIDLPPAGAVVYRPVRVGEIVDKVIAILKRGHAA